MSSVTIRSIELSYRYRYDHSIITLCLTFNDFKKALWKFNNSLLYDEEFLNSVNRLKHRVKELFSVTIFNMDNLQFVGDKNIVFTVNDQLFLETRLMEIKG